MKELFRKKSSDFDMIQDGMRKIQEFEEKKAQMEQALCDVNRKIKINGYNKCFLSQIFYQKTFFLF